MSFGTLLPVKLPTPRNKTMLGQYLIIPVIDYGDACCYDPNADLLDKLDRLLSNRI